VPCRRPAPSILLTAIAATVVLGSWAVHALPGADAADASRQTQFAQQPLTGLGSGETIRELHQAKPFSMVALTAADLKGTTARVRAKLPNGAWGPWYSVEGLDGIGDGGPGPDGTEPVFVGRTTTVQIGISRQTPAPQPQARPSVGKPLGYVPASVEHPMTVNAVLITPPKAPVDPQWTPPDAVTAPGQPPNIITRAQWGADESLRCGPPKYDAGIRAAVVHHTAGSNDYSPEDSAEIIRAIYAYHTRTLGWCDIAYHALVDKYGQVFEGRFGGITKPIEGSHTGGFNQNTWGVAMIGDFRIVPPTPIQLRTVGRLLGWRLGLDGVDPEGKVALTSEGSSYTFVPQGATVSLPTILTHRDVGNTECPGNAAYAAMDEIRDIAARFNKPLGPRDVADALRGGAIYNRWQATGGTEGPLGNPTSPEAEGAGPARYATFEKGAVYWSPSSGAEPVTGAIYRAWAQLGFERGVLGLPTSTEIPEPEWIVQNFQHGTLNFDRENGSVTRVVDGIPQEVPPAPDGPLVQLERFKPIDPR
jgi:uncharacterized protein with LGFP repeats